MNKASDLINEDFFVPSGVNGDRLHVRRLSLANATPCSAVMMYPGAVENARIFYTDSGKGLGPFLARAGFDVFACDPRGRGASTPTVKRGRDFGQTEIITEDLTSLAAAVGAKSAGLRQHWIAHSWGGVLMASHLVRYPRRAADVASFTCFGSKRSVTVKGLEKFIGIDLVWNRVAPFAAAIYGYLPAKKLNLGADSETRGTLADTIVWVNPANPWVDTVDGYDYGAAARSTKLPRALHLTGRNDRYLGNAVDVRRFMVECNLDPATLRIVGRDSGALHDYDHIDLLTHPEAARDHFPAIVAWLRASP